MRSDVIVGTMTGTTKKEMQMINVLGLEPADSASTTNNGIDVRSARTPPPRPTRSPPGAMPTAEQSTADAVASGYELIRWLRVNEQQGGYAKDELAIWPMFFWHCTRTGGGPARKWHSAQTCFRPDQKRAPKMQKDIHSKAEHALRQLDGDCPSQPSNPPVPPHIFPLL